MSRMIQISELTFAGRDRRRILENLNLSVERGEVLAVIGPPNSGKTLLLELLQGMVKPLSGQILVNDRNVTRLSPAKLQQLRQQLGVVPQQAISPAQLNLEEALRFKLSWLGMSAKQVERKSEEAIQALGLASLRSKHLCELNPVDQRTAFLALAVCHDPVLLMCDDPFMSLGEEGEATFALALAKIQQQRNLTLLVTGQRPAPLQRLKGRMLSLRAGGFHQVANGHV